VGPEPGGIQIVRTAKLQFPQADVTIMAVRYIPEEVVPLIMKQMRE
jgi:hypothetical protein